MKLPGQSKVSQIKKIIFFMESPFCQRDFERFGIELLLTNGFEVEVWDITNIIQPLVWESYKPPDQIDWSGCKTFSNKRAACRVIKGLPPDTFIINLISYSPKSYYIYKAISISQASYAVFMAGAIPFASVTNSQGVLPYYKKLRKILSKQAIRIIINYIIYILRRSFEILPPSLIGIKTSNLILAGGENCLVYRYPTDKKTEILWAHTLDYDLFLEERKKPSIEQPIAVFLDEYLPFHSDYIYQGIKSPLTAERYYPLLNRFFNLVEQELGLKVIIAAHPRSNYEKHPDYFEERECIRGKTIQLVKDSKLVLTHVSTSVNFANLFYKPVIFLTSTDLEKSSESPYIKAMAEWFGHTPIFIDRETHIDWEQEMKVSISHYETYRRAYIKTDNSEDLPFWQIVANRLKQGIKK